MSARFILVTCVCLAIVIGSAWHTRAGDLNPPAGPVAPTRKPLGEIEPRIAVNAANTPGDANSVFRVSQPGSYYLAENVQGVAGKNGVVLAAPSGSITLDMNGFSVVGTNGSLSGVLGIGNTSVHNGDARDWGQDGICIDTGLVERVHAQANDRDGIHVAWGSLVRHCRCEANGDDGISAGDTTRIEDNMGKGNGGFGVNCDGACSVTDCLLYNNDLGGVNNGFGIVKNCELFSNSGPAITDRGSSLITGNAIQSALTGILETGDKARIEGNTITFCVKGIEVDGVENLIIRNHASGNTTNFDIAPGNITGTIVTTEADLNTAANCNANVGM